MLIKVYTDFAGKLHAHTRTHLHQVVRLYRLVVVYVRDTCTGECDCTYVRITITTTRTRTFAVGVLDSGGRGPATQMSLAFCCYVLCGVAVFAVGWLVGWLVVALCDFCHPLVHGALRA